MLAISKVLALLFVLGFVSFASAKVGSKFKLALRGESHKALPTPRKNLVDEFERHVEMYRARAVRVSDKSVTIAYVRPNRTKGNASFEMDRAFYRVYEGDTGVLVIFDQEVDSSPFYQFINDRDIPTIDDVLEVGTGDELTDNIFRSLRESKLNGV